MTETSEALIAYCRGNNRICPQPDRWNQMWEMLPDRRQIGADWQPPLPLILAAWHDTPPQSKMLRLAEHIQLRRFFVVSLRKIGIISANEISRIMPIPTYDQLLRPLLELGTQGDLTRRSGTEAMTQKFKLTPAEAEQRLPSGGATYIRNRVGWAMSFLTKEDLLPKLRRRPTAQPISGRNFYRNTQRQYPWPMRRLFQVGKKRGKPKQRDVKPQYRKPLPNPIRNPLQTKELKLHSASCAKR
jgi:Mrr N-terminal domain